MSTILEYIDKYYKDENFLISKTNNGIYKRSVKDLENNFFYIKIINISDDSIELSLNENIKVVLDKDIKKLKCSCPSNNFCKHIVISILYINKNYIENTNNNEKENNQTQNKYYKEIVDINVEDIIKISNKKNFKYAVENFEKDNITFDENENSIKAYTKEYTIYFPNTNSIEKSICSCEDNDIKSLCTHKIMAILKYKLINNSLENIDKYLYSQKDDIDINILYILNNIIEDIFNKGIYSCNDNDIYKLEKIATKLQVNNFPEISKLVRSLYNNIESMILKKSYFNKVYSFRTISKLYNTIKLIKQLKEENNYKEINSIIGEVRSTYKEQSDINLISLGASPFITSSGYYGISIYLYNLENKEIYTYSTVSPTFYKDSFDDINKIYTSKNHFNSSIEELSKHNIKFKNPKINNNNKISSSKSTIIELTDRINYNFIKNIKTTNKELFTVDNKNINYNYFYNNKKSYNIFILEFIELKNIKYNKEKKILYFDIIDINNQIINLYIRKNIVTSIEYIKNYKNSEIDKNRFIVLEKTTNRIKPISIINMNSLINIYF